MKSNVDLNLVRQATEGNTAAIEELLLQCQPFVARFARRHCPIDDVEDAVQESLWTVYQKISTLRTSEAFVSWTFKVVRRHCYRLWLLNGVKLAPQLIETLSAGDDQVLHEDLKQDIVSALARLPVVYRQIVIMRDFEGYTSPEVAEQLGLTLDTVKSRLHKGRRLMREMLAHWAA
jgi:RNA polymerase sigma factor (sigma-70 family)